MGNGPSASTADLLCDTNEREGHAIVSLWRLSSANTLSLSKCGGSRRKLSGVRR